MKLPRFRPSQAAALPSAFLIALTFASSIANPNAAIASNSDSAIQVENHETGSEVQYSVVLLRGTVPSENDAPMTIVNKNAPAGADEVKVLTDGERFKALVELSEGKNAIQLKHGSAPATELVLTYKPQNNPHYVRLIWMTDQSGETDFAVPDDSVTQDYAKRLRTAALLMQTFTAERMKDLGYGPRTFALEHDENGQVVVHTWKGDADKQDYYAQADNNSWWQQVRRWINNEHPDRLAKNVVLAAYTRKDPRTGKMLGHTALGGANLGLFGSASVFCWPRDIQSAMDVFQDNAAVDATHVHDDSAFRGTIWALASTTIGATLHETGHAMGLPHCTDNMGIMTRGFDHFHRVFTFADPPSNQNKQTRKFSPEQEAYFSPVSASFLRWSPWFQLNAATTESSGRSRSRPSVEVDEEAQLVRIKSDSGIPWIGFHSKDRIETFREYGSHDAGADDHPKTIDLTFDQIQDMKPGTDIRRIVVVDSNGASRNVSLPQTAS
ncbi:metallopeptidase [Rhodopirellula bahusiensis]|uniref:metallopeptidase n=1 Tax=Rhodopirellula bahusiensis TaxID=2014065 RepID=UPI003263C3C7